MTKVGRKHAVKQRTLPEWEELSLTLFGTLSDIFFDFFKNIIRFNNNEL